MKLSENKEIESARKLNSKKSKCNHSLDIGSPFSNSDTSITQTFRLDKRKTGYLLQTKMISQDVYKCTFRY